MEEENFHSDTCNNDGETIEEVQPYEDSKDIDYFTDHKEILDSLPSVDAYIEKIEEYRAALFERDQVIEQLKDCICESDQNSEENKIKYFEATRELDSLKQTLGESVSLLQSKTPVSVVEHLELKNKLIEMQQDRFQDKETLELLTQEIKCKREAYSDLEQKYKLMKKMHNDVNERHLTELEERKRALEKKHKDELNYLMAQHVQEMEERDAQEQVRTQKSLEEFNRCNEELNEIKKQSSLLIEKMNCDEINAEAKVQELLLQIQTQNQLVEHLQNEKENQVLESNKELEQLVKEIREKYEKELNDLKCSHKTEIALVTEHIDLIEKKQNEEQGKIMENLTEIYNEGVKYKKELEEERERNDKLIKDLMEARLMVSNLEPKCSILEMELKSEKECLDKQLKSLNEMTEAKESLNNKILNYENEIKTLHANEQRQKMEYKELMKEFELEKENKNLANLEIQNLNSKNESLLSELDTNRCQYSLALENSRLYQGQAEELKCKLEFMEEEKISFGNKISLLENELKGIQVLEKDIVDLKFKLSEKENENEILCHTVTDLNAKVTENSDLEARVTSLSQEIQSCEKYKYECHALNEKIYDLCQILGEKEKISSESDVLRDCTMTSELCDPFSLLESKVTFMSDKLNVTESEFHSILQEKDYYKEKLNKLNSKFKEKSQFESIFNTMNQKDNINIKNSDIKESLCGSCQTVRTTRDHGFQTSFDPNTSGLVASQTIEEDYMIEEILIVPNIALKKSVSLKNLNESLSESALSPGLAPLDYEQLKSKYHDSRYVIKSLENENSRLRRALQFKRSITDVQIEKPLKLVHNEVTELVSKCSEENVSRNQPTKAYENKELESIQSNNQTSGTNETANIYNTEIEIPEKEKYLLSLQKDGIQLNPQSVPCGRIECVNEAQREQIEVSKIYDGDDLCDLSMKLQLQTQLNEALMEELKTRFSNTDSCSDDWQDHLRRAVELFIENHHPYFQRKGDLLNSFVESWKEILKYEDNSDEKKEEEKDDVKDKAVGLNDLLVELKKLVSEQQEFQNAIKAIESNIINGMENNFLQITQGINKGENSLDLVYRDFDSTLFKLHTTFVDEDVETNDILREFQDILSSMMDRTQEGKMKLLHNQRNMLKILEENQAKITEILKKHLNDLKDTSVQGDIENLFAILVEEVDASLNGESISVEKMYGELLKQYTHEQAMHTQYHSLTLNELKGRLNSFLEQSRNQQSTFSNTDIWKRLLSVLSQITVNLLHYYTVSQRFANNEGDSQFVPDIIPAAGGFASRVFQSADESEEENSLKLEFEGQCPIDEGSMNILDTTGVSEGMLEDLERSEQVKEVLAVSYPNLAKALKGNYEQVSIHELEKEVQEFIISLQASTGMLRIFMLSKADDISSPSSKVVSGESGVGVNSLETCSLNIEKREEKQHTNSTQVEPDYLSKEFSNLSISEYTTLKPSEQIDYEAQIAELKAKLAEGRTEIEDIQKQLHQTKGLYAGLLDDNKSLHIDFKKSEETINQLIKELTETKDMLKRAESKENDPSMKLNKKQNERNIKERVKAVLAAKDKECLDQKELLDRVRDLEVILEETVTERDKSLEVLNFKNADLTQQLEVADRQLRSSRQFLDEQAAERDLEMEEVMKMNEKLKNQLKERESLASQHTGLQKEVQMLEKQLKEAYTALEEERTKIDEKQSDLSAAIEKVNDLREIVHSLETQLAGKCSEHQYLEGQNRGLVDELHESKQQNISLQNELDTLNQNNFASTKLIVMNPNELLYESHGHGHTVAPRHALQRQVSISEEIENSKRDLQCQTSLENHIISEEALNQMEQSDLTQDCTLVENLILRLEKSTQGLEALQFASMSCGIISDEELSVREQLEINGKPSLEKTRSLSPGSLEAKLEEKFLAFERCAEAAAKYISDLEMRLNNLKAEYDEVLNDREYLHQRLSALSGIKSELENASKESELLRKDFENNIRALKGDLTKSKQKEADLQAGIKDLKSKFTAKEDELINALKKEKILTKEINELTKVVRDYTEEKERFRKQNSEQLIKISSLEARVEEFRRPDSPHELELKTKINSLKDELESCRTELTLKFREVEELRYTVKELKDQLIVREEELDRLNQPLEHMSLPQSNIDQRRHLMQALEEELRSQKVINQQLQEKLQNVGESSSNDAVLSNALLSSLLDEKNSKIRDLIMEKKHLVESAQGVLVAIEKRLPLQDSVKILKNLLNINKEWFSQIDKNSCPEVQRRAPAPHHSLSDSEFREMNLVRVEKCDISEASADSRHSHSVTSRNYSSSASESSNLNLEPLLTRENDTREKTLNNVDRKDFNKSDIVEPLFSAKEDNDYEAILTENLVLKDQCAVLEQEVRNLIEYQKKLEADFEVAQEMLESKEEELQALTAEVDDCVPDPLQNASQLNEMLFENESLRQRIQELELRIESDVFNLVPVTEVEKVTDELDRLKKVFDEKLKRIEELEKEKENLNQTCSYLETRINQERLRCENLKQSLEGRNQEIKDMSLQMDRALTQQRDSNTRHEKRIKALERDHFKELQDMKDKNIEREKQLCNEYEDRLSAQVSDLSIKLSREKEESLKSYKNHYEELLSKAMKENIREVKHNDIRNGSAEDLQKDIRRELEISASLDQSLVSFFDGGGSVGSRESSVMSEGGASHEDGNNLKIQSLVKKIHKEGIQVLTLSERYFLTQSLIEEKMSENVQDKTTNLPSTEINVINGLSKKVEMLEFTLKQEKSLNEEMQETLRRARKEIDELRELLATERSKYFSFVTDASRVKGRVPYASKELLTANQEIEEMKEKTKAFEKQIKDLEKSLNAERENFNHVSTTLNHQREISSSTNDHHNHVIKELRNCLEKERTRVLALMNENHDLKSSRSQPLSLEDTLKNSFNPHSSLLMEKDMRITVALDKEREMQREIGTLQLTVQTLTDDRVYERDRYLKDLQDKRLHIEHLESAQMLLENKKMSLISELNGKDIKIKELKENITIFKKEISDLQEILRQQKVVSSRADADFPPSIKHRHFEENCNRKAEAVSVMSLNKMKQKEFEIEALQQRLSQVETELKLAKDREKYLLKETQKNLESDAFPRIKNLSEVLEIQQRENLDLCKSLARLTDDKRLLRQKILMLEGVIDELNLQLANQEKYLIRSNINEKNIHFAERAALSAETSALKLALRQTETKNEKFEREIEILQANMETGSMEMACKREDFTVKYLQGKFNRCESYRRALVWQKDYLISILNKCRRTEERTVDRLMCLARNGQMDDNFERYRNAKLKGKARFKCAALVVIAIQRMKIIVKKWQLGRKFKGFLKLPSLHDSPLPRLSPAALQPSSSHADLLGRNARSPQRVEAYVNNENAAPFQVTGLTPPTKDIASSWKRVPLEQANQNRNLFGAHKEEDNKDLNECIERLDYIHTQLGLPKSNS